VIVIKEILVILVMNETKILALILDIIHVIGIIKGIQIEAIGRLYSGVVVHNDLPISG